MKRIYFLPVFLLFMGLLKQYDAQAQCPTSVTLDTTNYIAASCPSNGSIRITSNAPIGTLTYTITSGPTGYNPAPQSDSNFYSLAAGTYTVSASCGGTVLQTVNFTIDNNYTLITITSATASPTTCSKSSDGAIDITESGGSLPMEYSVVLQGQPDNYQPASPTRSANYTGLDTGTYTVKVKDACGSVQVQTVQVTTIGLPPVNPQFQLVTATVCNPANDTIQFNGLVDANGAGVNDAPYLGNLTVKIYDGTSASDPLLGIYTLTADAQRLSVPVPTTANGYYIVTVTSPCNDTLTQQWAGAVPAPAKIDFTWGSDDCSGSAGGTFSLMSTQISNVIFPITIKLTNKATGVTTTRTYNSSDLIDTQNLPVEGIDTGAYDITITDACLNNVNVNPNEISMSKNDTPSIAVWSDLSCISQPGYGSFQFHLVAPGYIPGSFSNSTKYIIVSGPSGVGDTISTRAGVFATDIVQLLGGNYRIAVVTPCAKDTLPVTIASTDVVLVSNVTATATSFCGSGGSVSIASANYNGTGTVSYILYNTATGAEVPYDNNPADTLGNAGTIWANLPAGSYQIAMEISNYCNGGGDPYIITGNTVTITNGGVPSIVRKFGLINRYPI